MAPFLTSSYSLLKCHLQCVQPTLTTPFKMTSPPAYSPSIYSLLFLHSTYHLLTYSIIYWVIHSISVTPSTDTQRYKVYEDRTFLHLQWLAYRGMSVHFCGMNKWRRKRGKEGEKRLICYYPCEKRERTRRASPKDDSAMASKLEQCECSEGRRKGRGQSGLWEPALNAMLKNVVLRWKAFKWPRNVMFVESQRVEGSELVKRLIVI